MVAVTNQIHIIINVGSETEFETCVPFISEYTDCTDDNRCSGCSKCKCTAEGKWNCQNIQKCPEEDSEEFSNLDDDDIDRALKLLETEVHKKEAIDKAAAAKFPFVPEPDKRDDFLLEDINEKNMEDEILALMRSRRSVDAVQQGDKDNSTSVTFYHTVDEMNEDTLKNHNLSGSILAQKVNTIPQISRRTSSLNNSSSNALQIEYTQSKEFKHHEDNKIDTPAIHDDKEDLIVHSNIRNIIGNNHSYENKDKDLSKMLVNELKKGASEIIGDKKAPVISNITFTPENDTLTAMAFIAGNLLNKLWNMEKDAGDDHIDTEVLKREKISDLLELFKEPLDMRQEMFLKNALEQLSSALNQNKNVDNISLCKSVESVKKSILDIHKDKLEVNTDCSKDKEDKKENQNAATEEALRKINGVLVLLNKYENVHQSLRSFKSRNIYDITDSGTNVDKDLTKDEKSSLDLYGKTLETITKLLVPNSKSKKVVQTLQNSNIFTKNKDLGRKLSDMELKNMNVTIKDRIVLDYLAHIQSKPDCLLKKRKDKVSLPSIEGNILLNLSEFFKIKSLSDLVKLVETEKSSNPALRSSGDIFPKSVEESTTESVKKDNFIQLKDTKEKLKGHLKSILEDIIEIQKAEGKGKKDIHIIEVLPCIYNLFNASKEDMKISQTSLVNKTTSVNRKPLEKLQEIFKNLKKELKFAQTRRTNTLNGQRPKSAVVWERIIKNAKEIQTFKTRRNLVEEPKTIEELKAMINKIESGGSNTYKTFAFFNEVPPSERLLLLKTFNSDTIKYIKILELLYELLQTKSVLPKGNVSEFNEFLDNVAINVNLNERVIKNLGKPKQPKILINSIDRNRLSRNNAGLKLQQPVYEQTAHGTKLTRDQIIGQLIKNRILLYIQRKEATGEILYDINYDIAKKILIHLEVGNFQLARELYKVFASQTQKDGNVNKIRNIGLENKSKGLYESRRRPFQLEPLIKFDDSKSGQMVNQDHFIKQLLNLKNMK